MAAQPFLAGPVSSGLVSVVIPSFNRAPLLAEAISSALGQSYTNLEVIVADDGSTDNTAEVVGKFSDQRIRYLALEHRGMSATRNAALDAANGEFIAFLDSDDVWLPWKLEAQLTLFARHPEVGMIWTDMSAYDGGRVTAERFLRRYYGAYSAISFAEICPARGTLGSLMPSAPSHLRDDPYHVGNIFTAMFNGNLVHPPTAIVRRSRLQESGGFDSAITGHGAEDYHFYFKVAEKGDVAFIDSPAILYRVHDGQMSTVDSAAEAVADLRVIRHWVNARPHILTGRALRIRLASTYRWLGAVEFENRNHRAAARYFMQSLRLQPRQPAVVTRLVLTALPAPAIDRLRAFKQLAQQVHPARLLLSLGVVVLGMLLMLYQLIAVLQPEIAAP